MALSDNSYWCSNGKYQKSYDKLYEDLVPSYGKAETPDGELLRWISKIYYRYYNDGDTYSYFIEEWNFSIIDIKGIDSKLLDVVDCFLSYGSEEDLEKAVNLVIEYLMIKRSTKDTIWNPETCRLVKVNTPKGLSILKGLKCTISYQLSSSYDVVDSPIDSNHRLISLYSSKDKVYNPNTGRKVNLYSPMGIQILKDSGFDVVYNRKYGFA